RLVGTALFQTGQLGLRGALARDQPHVLASDKDAVHLDGLPTFRENNRPRPPARRISRAEAQAGEPEKAAHQETTGVRHERTNPRLVGKACGAEFVGFAEWVLDEIAVALLQEAERAGPITQPRGEDTE